jgi:hypothetical protein
VKAKPTQAQIDALAERSADAYSADDYASWKACAAALLRRGYTDRQAEEILRSKITRWAIDASDKPEGRATSSDLLRFIDRCPGDVIAVLYEMGVYTLSDQEWADYYRIKGDGDRNCTRSELLDRAIKLASERAPELATDALRVEVESTLNFKARSLSPYGGSRERAEWFVGAVATDVIERLERSTPRKRSRARRAS